MLPLVIVSAVVALVIVLVVVTRAMERKRREALQAAARELGLEFFPVAPAILLQELTPLYLFSRGHGKKLTNLLQGDTNKTQLQIFDYRYTVGGGKESHTYQQTVVHFRDQGLNLPAFSLRPENIFHRIGSLFGYQDIDFDSHPKFSRQYLLRGKDEEAIRGLFGEAALSHFEENPGLNVEGSGGDLLLYRSGRRVKPEELRSFLEEGLQVLALFQPAGPPDAGPG